MASSKRCTGESGSVNDNVGFFGGFLGSFGDSGTGYFSSLTILEIKVVFLPFVFPLEPSFYNLVFIIQQLQEVSSHVLRSCVLHHRLHAL